MSDGLLPDALPVGTVSADRELPQAARTWGRLLDVSNLKPGDLILTRPIKGDYVSQNIVRAQKAGGFVDRHAQWTHAAIYLGDGNHICEASFKETGFNSGVNIRSIQHYSSSEYAIKARRPKLSTDQQRISIAIGAMTNIGKGYNFWELFRFMIAAYSGRGFWGQPGSRQRINPGALVCSTLYQDAYNFSLGGATLRLGNLCTPAHLSASSDFDATDPSIQWNALK